MKLVIYGDFNCPYSFLAGTRADALLRGGLAEVDWRAVEHDPAIPKPSEPVDGELATMLDREVEEVRGLLLPGEIFPIKRPPVHPNTAPAVAAFAAAPAGEAHELRRALFGALWSQGLDIGEEAVVRQLGARPADAVGPVVTAWWNAWQALDRPLVPMLVLPDGDVYRGLDSLDRLAGLLAAVPGSGDPAGMAT